MSKINRISKLAFVLYSWLGANLLKEIYQLIKADLLRVPPEGTHLSLDTLY